MNSMNEKFRNQPFWVDPLTGYKYKSLDSMTATMKERAEHWDSMFEFTVFLSLQKQYKDKKIERQKRVCLLPKTQHFKALYWKVDFCLPENNLLIEAKGDWILHNGEAMKSLAQKVHLLKLFHPTVDFLLVGESEWNLTNSTIKSVMLNNLT